MSDNSRRNQPRLTLKKTTGGYEADARGYGGLVTLSILASLGAGCLVFALMQDGLHLSTFSDALDILVAITNS